jgi:hypothetical protein
VRATRPTAGGVLRVLGLVLAWVVVAVPAWLLLFTHSSATMVLASHDAVVHPTFDGRARLDMGPYLPDLRTTSGGRIGVSVEMGKTTATTTTELAQRYATIAAHPDAEVERIHGVVGGLARDAALRAGVLALLPIGGWLLLGRRRRHELERPGWRAAVAVVVVLGVGATLLVQPWRADREQVSDEKWLPVQAAVPEVTVPEDLRSWQIQGGLITRGTRPATPS